MLHWAVHAMERLGDAPTASPARREESLEVTVAGAGSFFSPSQQFGSEQQPVERADPELRVSVKGQQGARNDWLMLASTPSVRANAANRLNTAVILHP